MPHVTLPTALTLKRYPVHNRQALRAWDAADEYLLQTLPTRCDLTTDPRMLILNDHFGALGLGLIESHPTWVSDSWLAARALADNAGRNGLDLDQIRVQTAVEPLEGVYDVVLIRLPKSMALLEDQLHRLREHLHDQTLIIAPAMARHVHSATLTRFERLLGPTSTSLAQRKARLIFSQFDAALTPGPSPYPSHYRFDETAETYLNHANVFSRDKPDLGSRLLMAHLPQHDHLEHLIDLACGNGLLGIAAARRHPQARVSFVDESHMAVASARHNVQALLGDQPARRFDFRVTDCLMGFDCGTADLILNNPPFHQQHAVGDFIARQMFRDAHRVLKTDGELWVVANRHLGYHLYLKRLFGHCQTVTGNRKFVILRAIRSSD